MLREPSPCPVFGTTEDLPATPRNRHPPSKVKDDGSKKERLISDKDDAPVCTSADAEPAWSRVRTPTPEFIHRDVRSDMSWPPFSCGLQPRPAQPTETLAPSPQFCAFGEAKDSLADHGNSWLAWRGAGVPQIEITSSDAAYPGDNPPCADSNGCKSRGSAGHPHTCALPCKYFVKMRGCKDGAACDHCHECVWKSRTRRERLGDGSTKFEGTAPAFGPPSTKPGCQKQM